MDGESLNMYMQNRILQPPKKRGEPGSNILDWQDRKNGKDKGSDLKVLAGADSFDDLALVLRV
jgi:hypothetical protein